MTKPIVFIFSLIISLSTYCQNNNDSIKKVNRTLFHYYELNGQMLSYGKMTTLMKENNEAIHYLKKAKTLNTLSILPGVAGGYCIVYPIVCALDGKKANVAQLAIGCGLTAIYIPIVISANKQVRKAVDAYNQTKTAAYNTGNNYDVSLGLSQNGFGLTLRF